MIGFSKLTVTSLAILLLGLGWVSLAQVQEKTKAKPPPPKAPAPKPDPAKAPPKKPAATQPPSASVKPIPDEDADERKPNEKTPPDKTPSDEQPSDDSAGETAIQQSAEAFVLAYNNHDAQAVAALFALKAEFLDEDGNLIQGRAAIEQDFAGMFAAHPECKIAIEVDSVRLLTPNIALEEGLVRGTPIPDGPEALTNYTAIHVKVEGAWLIASVSDTEVAAEQITPQDHLQQLAWMVGDWMDESPDSIIKSSCDWDASGNYLLHEFAVQIAGGMSASGSIRIGWDPLTRQLKSWVFDADGSYAEGLWTRIDEEWQVHLRGVNAEGTATSATSVYRYIDDDTMSWRSYDRTVGGEPVDDIPENLIKRHPPPPEG